MLIIKQNVDQIIFLYSKIFDITFIRITLITHQENFNDQFWSKQISLINTNEIKGTEDCLFITSRLATELEKKAIVTMTVLILGGI